MYRPPEEKSPPVGGFSLSVAGYVVKARAGKFKRKEKCKNRRKIRPFLLEKTDFPAILALFLAFELSCPGFDHITSHRERKTAHWR